LAWLRPISSENVGPAKFLALVNEFGCAEAAIDALPALSRRGGRIHDIRLCGEEEAEDELATAESMGATLAAIGEAGYPPALAQVDAPPPLLYVKGKLELAEMSIVAIVGARNGSVVGQKFTRTLATDLGDEGFVIASGLARGIDTATHLAAPERGTIAVLAGGIDNVYPPENEELHQAIAEQGLVNQRASALLLAARQGLPAPQPPHLRDLAWRGRGRGRRALRLSRRGLPGSKAARCLPCREAARSAGAGTNNLLKQCTCIARSARDIFETLAPILGRPVQPPAVELAASDRERTPEAVPIFMRASAS
jgi:DNA processing protein